MRAIATTAGALGAAGRGIITQNNNDTQSSGSPGDGVKGARPIHLVANPALHSAGHGRGFERWMGKPRLIPKRRWLIDARSLGDRKGTFRARTTLLRRSVNPVSGQAMRELLLCWE